MISRIAGRIARGLLSRIEHGDQVGQEVALDRLPFVPETVIKGYLNAHFPMADEAGRIRWRAPQNRCVIPIDDFHIPKNLARLVRRGDFEIRFDTAFDQVVEACRERDQCWITPQMQDVYSELHRIGVARSVEAWKDGELAGGLFGICLGSYFSTESQFHSVRDAGKVAFAHLFDLLQQRGFLIHDVQYLTPFLEQFGAVLIPDREFRQQHLRAVVRRAEFAPVSADSPACQPQC